MTMTKIAMFVAAAVLAAGSAGAQPVVVAADSPPTARVSFADLNLETEAGKARLEKRIRAVASNLCLGSPRVPIEEFMWQRKCYNSALADGLKQMDRIIAARENGSALAAAALTIRSQ